MQSEILSEALEKSNGSYWRNTVWGVDDGHDDDSSLTDDQWRSVEMKLAIALRNSWTGVSYFWFSLLLENKKRQIGVKPNLNVQYIGLWHISVKLQRTKNLKFKSKLQREIKSELHEQTSPLLILSTCAELEVQHLRFSLKFYSLLV